MAMRFQVFLIYDYEKEIMSERNLPVRQEFLGLSAAIEGPFSKNYSGSYLVNYRFSTLTILSKIGMLV
jgi:hypothetical protein